MTTDVSKSSRKVSGCRPCSWQLGRSRELGSVLKADIPRVPAVVPGSVQAALRDAGLIPDWKEGLDFLDCEWVEYPHWEFFTDIEAELIPNSITLLLCPRESAEQGSVQNVNTRRIALTQDVEIDEE